MQVNRQPRSRVEWRARLRCRDWHMARRVATANVSRGGVFLVTDEPPAVGAIVDVGVELPDGTMLTLAAECVHVRSSAEAFAQGRPAGFGARFRPADAADLMLLEELAQAAGVPTEVRDEREGGPHRLAAPAAAAAAPPPAPRVAPRPPAEPPTVRLVPEAAGEPIPDPPNGPTRSPSRRGPK